MCLIRMFGYVYRSGGLWVGLQEWRLVGRLTGVEACGYVYRKERMIEGTYVDTKV